MCVTCKRAQHLPVAEALALIAQEMKKGPKSCLDLTLGQLVGVTEVEQDQEADTAWEESRR